MLMTFAIKLVLLTFSDIILLTPKMNDLTSILCTQSNNRYKLDQAFCYKSIKKNPANQAIILLKKLYRRALGISS